jgi:hypothetical protein
MSFRKDCGFTGTKVLEFVEDLKIGDMKMLDSKGF